MTAEFDRQVVHDEMARTKAIFRDLVDTMSVDDLRRRTSGTRWTNREMLFHMLFGYLLVLTLTRLVKLINALPKSAQRLFAATLNASNRPFHWVNYIGSVAGGRVLCPSRMLRLFDWATNRLARKLDGESAGSLTAGMNYPTRWDPFFKSYMTLGDVYHYPTQHFDFHRQQLTVEGA